MENDYFDVETRQELLKISDPQEIEDRFYTDLKFGTGGMRGVLGAGTNRMNRYLIRKVSQALADTIREEGQEACDRGVVISFDSRRFSAEFALETALVLGANGIKAYLFDDLRPTPELSFAVRYLNAIAGVNITASHNPKEYNGFKVYWEDGGQLSPKQADQIAAKMAKEESWEINLLDKNQALESGMLQMIGQEIDRAYEAEVKKTLFNVELSQTAGKELKIVYTPLHGTGGGPVQRVLRELGFTSLWIVPEQEMPDPEFPTVITPNPEDPSAFTLALQTAKKLEADLVLATDPDGDRLGAYAKDRRGNYHRFSGNQIGVILEYYILSQRKRLGKLPERGVLVKTVASTDLGDIIAADFGVKTINVLVGFKYIGEKIKEMEREGWGTYLFGFEESHGYLAGTYARDKDGIQASALLAEAALYYLQKEGKTLPEVLEGIFHRYGTYLDEQIAILLAGKEGKERISAVIDRLRRKKPSFLGGIELERIEDFQTGLRWKIRDKKEEKTGLPQENALRFSFRGGGFVMVRPSGTEPKIRFYFCIRGQSREKAEQILARVKDEVFAWVDDLLKE
ncbi:MAG TPA: phospho-sugar mutase [Clostridia bacterium]|nr:phospho-sugar mutase [Clostridia bacterium]